MQMLAELGQPHFAADGHAVVDDVQVRALEVDDLLASSVLDPGVADVPLAGNGPVEDLCAGPDFLDFEWDDVADSAQRLAETITRDAAADRVKLRDEAMHPVARGSEIVGCEELIHVVNSRIRQPRRTARQLHRDRRPVQAVPLVSLRRVRATARASTRESPAGS